VKGTTPSCPPPARWANPPQRRAGERLDDGGPLPAEASLARRHPPPISASNMVFTSYVSDVIISG
jgi:hypothetical protein